MIETDPVKDPNDWLTRGDDWIRQRLATSTIATRKNKVKKVRRK